AARIVAPGGAGRDRRRKAAQEHDIEGDLAADRAANVGTLEAAVPHARRIDEERAVQTPEKHRQRPSPSLRPGDREAVIEVRDRDAPSGQVVPIESPEQANRVETDVEAPELR